MEGPGKLADVGRPVQLLASTPRAASRMLKFLVLPVVPLFSMACTSAGSTYAGKSAANGRGALSPVAPEAGPFPSPPTAAADVSPANLGEGPPPLLDEPPALLLLLDEPPALLLLLDEPPELLLLPPLEELLDFP